MKALRAWKRPYFMSGVPPSESFACPAARYAMLMKNQTSEMIGRRRRWEESEAQSAKASGLSVDEHLRPKS